MSMTALGIDGSRRVSAGGNAMRRVAMRGVWEEGRRAVAGSSRRIHEHLDLNMNRERSFYHEYEYENAAAIMSMNSKRKAIFNSTHVNRLVFMRSSACAS